MKNTKSQRRTRAAQVQRRALQRQCAARQFFRPVGERLEDRRLLAAITWDGEGGANGDWWHAANWTGDTIPGAADTAIIDLPGAYTVTLSGNAVVGELVLGGAGSSPTLDLGDRLLTINSRAQVAADATLRIGSGQIDGSSATATLENSGTLWIGANGVVSWSGHYTQTAEGSLGLDVAGTPASDQFGKLFVTGQATFDGDLEIDLRNGYAPTPINSFEALRYGSVAGSFDQITGLTIGTVPVLKFVQNSTNGLLIGQANVFTVTTTADSGAGSFNQIIADANATPVVDYTGDGQVDPHLIRFLLPVTDGGHVYYRDDGVSGKVTFANITSTAAARDSDIADLDPDWQHSWWSINAGPPIVTTLVVIDGYTQPGASPNTQDVGTNAVLTVEMNLESAGGGGIRLAGGDSTVRGLVLNRAQGSPFTTGSAVYLASARNVIEGNYVGLDPSGTLSVRRAEAGARGIRVENVPDNRIGGATPAARNVIAGNNSNEIYVNGASATGTVIQGNYLGITAPGTAIVPRSYGVIFQGGAGDGTFGGPTSVPGVAPGNVLGGVSGSGLVLNNSDDNVIQGNIIGLLADGMTEAANSNSAISVEGSSNRNLIGGPSPSERNVLSGNYHSGVWIDRQSVGNVVQGNFIGTNVAGTAAVGNGVSGVIHGSAFNTITQNVISGNNGPGIELSSSFFGAVGPIDILGNWIGTDASGTIPLGNQGEGIQIQSAKAGSITTIRSNVIAHNEAAGISIYRDKGYVILSNRIYDNADLAIDLYDDGVSPNDLGDADEGPNDLQNFPVLSSGTTASGVTTIQGTLNSLASRTFRIEFFASPAADSSGYGEGQAFLGGTDVVTDGSGNATFSWNSPSQVPVGEFVTSTTTLLQPGGAPQQTSEFSAAVLVTGDGGGGGGDVEDVSTQLRTGATQVFAQLSDWGERFDLDTFYPAGVPFELPGLADQLNSIFDVRQVLENLAAPVINIIDTTFADLRNHLEALGFTIDCIQGGSGVGGEPAPCGDALIQVRYERDAAHNPLEPLGRSSSFTSNLFNDQTAGLLRGLATASAIDTESDYSVGADLSLRLVFGVDSTGFYLLDESQLALEIEAAGELSGSAELWGDAITVSGTMSTADLRVTLYADGDAARLRLDDLDGTPAPQTLLVPAATGTVTVGLNADTTALSLEWTGEYELAATPQHVVSSVERMTLIAALNLPELHALGGGDVNLELEGVYDGGADTWTLEFHAAADAEYELVEIELSDLHVQATLTPTSLSGEWSATTTVEFGDGATEDSLSITGEFDAERLDLTATLRVSDRTLGTPPVFTFAEAILILDVDAEFGGGATGGVQFFAENAALLSRQTNDGLTARATGVWGVVPLTGGVSEIQADSVRIRFGDVMHVSAGDVQFRVGNGVHQFADIRDLAVSFPSLPGFPRASLDSLIITRDGITVSGLRVAANNSSTPSNCEPRPGDAVGPVDDLRRPVLVLPGIGGSYAKDLTNDVQFLLNRGLHPTELQLDPLAGSYADIVKSLVNVGYVKGVNLFEAAYDWRLPPGPTDNVIDGHIAGLTGDSITDQTFEHGVDYLGYWLRQAAESWAINHPGVALDGVDIIVHSTGGLVARSYLQSDAYGQPFTSDTLGVLNLPRIHDLIMAGVPNRGALLPWNVLHDNWIADPPLRLVLSTFVNRAYEKLLAGATITGPTAIRLADVLGPDQQPDPEIFIAKYIPTLRALLATYDFLEPLAGQPKQDINGNPDVGNQLLLDLNKGLDLNRQVGDFEVNDFVELLERRLHVFYGTSATTPVTAQTWRGENLAQFISLTDEILPMGDFLARDPAADEIWYQDLRLEQHGDGTVPLESSVFQFAGDDRVSLHPFRKRLTDSGNGNTDCTIDHGALLTNFDLQRDILAILGYDNDAAIAAIAVGTAPSGLSVILDVTNYANQVGQLALPIVTVQVDPMNGYIADVHGRRLGYDSGVRYDGTRNGGIPNSFYLGGEDGIGYIVGAYEGPLTYHAQGVGRPWSFQVGVTGAGLRGGIKHGGEAFEEYNGEVPIESIFGDFGLGELLELRGPSLTPLLSVSFQGDSIVLTGSIEVHADGAAILPDYGTTELDGVATVTNFNGSINLDTGELKLSADRADVTFGTVVTASATGNGPDEPGLALSYLPGDDRRDATLATVRNLKLNVPGLQDAPDDFLRLNSLELLTIRRDGFELTKSFGSPDNSIALGDFLTATGLVATINVNVTLPPDTDEERPFRTVPRVTGSFTVQADSAALFPNGDGAFTATATDLDGSFSLSDPLASLVVSAAKLEISLGTLATFSASNLTLNLAAAANQPIVVVPATRLAVNIPGLESLGDVVVTGTGAEIYRDRAEIDLLEFAIEGPIAAPGLFAVSGIDAQVDQLRAEFATGETTFDELSVGFATVDLFGGLATLVPLPGESRAVEGRLLAAGSAQRGTEWKFGLLAARVDDLLDVSAMDGTLQFGGPATVPPTPLLEVAVAEVTLPALSDDLRFTATDLALSRQGTFALASAAILGDDLLDKVGLGGFLPFELDAIEPLAVDGQPLTLNHFGLHIDGQFDLTPFTGDLSNVVVQIGGLDLTSGASDFEFELEVREGAVTFPSLDGPVTLGFRDLPLGSMKVTASVTLGQFEEGTYTLDSLGAYLGVEVDSSTSISASATGQLLPLVDGGTRLELDSHLAFSFDTGPGGLARLDVTNFEADFDLYVELDDGFGLIRSGATFNSARVGSVDIRLGEMGDELLLMTSTDVRLNLTDESLPLLTFGELTASLPKLTGMIPGFEQLEGTVSNFAIDRDFSFLPLEGFGAEFRNLPSAQSFGLPDWFPLELTGLGLKLGPQALAGNPLDIQVILSGGFNSSANFPIEANVTGLKVNVLNLANLFNPAIPLAEQDLLGALDGLEGFSVGLAKPIKIGEALSVGGQLGLRLIDHGNRKALVGTIGGTFEIAGFGGGVELTFAEVGPIMAKLDVPLGVPLGPTGILMTGVSGGFRFGGPEFEVPIDPETGAPSPIELLRAETTFDPLHFNATQLDDEIRRLLTDGDFTWTQTFTLALQGDFTTVATPGVLTGTLNIAAQVVPPAPGALPTIKFLGSGDASVFGIQMGAVGALLDFTHILAPTYDFAFKAPSPNNPLGFLFPANAEFTMHVDTKGMVEAPLIGLRTFLLGAADAAADLVLSGLAGPLQADHNRPLAQVLLDTSRDGVVDAGENLAVIDGDYLKNVLNQLLPASFDAFQGAGFDALHATRLGQALLSELMTPGRFATVLPTGSADVHGFFQALADSAAAAIAAAGDAFNPSLTLHGVIQPMIFGIPLGPPSEEIDLTINKDQLSFAYEVGVKDVVKRSLSLVPGAGGILDLLSLGLDSRLAFGFTLDFPDEIATVLATGNAPTPQALIDAINPFANWEVLVGGSMTFLGFPIAKVSGFMFAPSDGGEGLFQAHVVNLDLDGDDKLSDDEQAQGAHFLDEPDKIPITRTSRYENARRFGGILLTGQLSMPAMVFDPVQVLTGDPHELDPATGKPLQPLAIDWTLPDIEGLDLFETFDAYKAYLQEVVEKLTANVEWGRIQLYIPSPAEIFDVEPFEPGTNARPSYLDPYSGDDDGAPREVLVPCDDDDPTLLVTTEGCFRDLGNGRYDPLEDFLDVGNGVYDPGEELSRDVNGNGLFDPGDDFVDGLNAIYDGPESFIDTNRNGQLDRGEEFIDRNGNGAFDGGVAESEPATDLDGDGRIGAGEFTDLNDNGVWDRAAEKFVDTGNGRFDGGGRPRVQPRPLDDPLRERLQEILGAAYFEGFVNAQLFSIPLGTGTIDATMEGLRAEISIPALLGLKGEFGIGFRNVSLNDTLSGLVHSPLASPILAALGIDVVAGDDASDPDDDGDAFAFLDDPLMPQFYVPFPVATLGVSLGTDNIAESMRRLLVEKFGLPEPLIGDALDAIPGNANLTLQAYTPGYSADPTAGVQYAGGFAMDAELDVDNLVDNAQFHFELEFPRLDDLSTLVFPNFVARASVDELRLPGLASLLGDEDAPDLFKLSNFALELSKQTLENGAGVEFGLSLQGRVTVLEDLLIGTVNGDLTMNFGGAPEDDGIYGALDIVVDARSTKQLGDGQQLFAFDGDFSLRVNTTGHDLTIDLPLLPPESDPTIPARSGRLYFGGSLVTPIGSLEGAFLFEAARDDPGTPAVNERHLHLGAFARHDNALLGSFLVSGSLNTDAAGMYGGLALLADTTASGPVTSIGGFGPPPFSFAGGFVMQINASAIEREVAFPGLAAGDLARFPGVDAGLIPPTLAPFTLRVALDGTLHSPMGDFTGAFQFSAGSEGLFVSALAHFEHELFGSFLASGTLTIDDDGLYGGILLAREQGTQLQFGEYSFAGVYSLQVNATGASRPIDLPGVANFQDAFPTLPLALANPALDEYSIRVFLAGQLTSPLGEVEGAFRFQVGVQQVNVDAYARYESDLLGDFLVSSNLTIDQHGLYGGLLLARQDEATLGFGPTDSSRPFELHGQFLLQVNATSAPRPIPFTGAAGFAGLDGDDINPDLAPFTIRVLLLGGMTTPLGEFEGAFRFSVGSQGLDASIYARYLATQPDSSRQFTGDLFGNFIASGTLTIDATGIHGGVLLARQADDEVQFGPGNDADRFRLQGVFSLQVNASSQPQRIHFEGATSVPGLDIEAFNDELAPYTLRMFLSGGLTTPLGDMDGAFRFSVGTQGLEVHATLRHENEVLGTFLGTGDLFIDARGMAAGIALARQGASSLFHSSSTFALLVNATNASRDDLLSDLDGFNQVTIPDIERYSIGILVQGTLGINQLDAGGVFYAQAGVDGLEVSLTQGVLDLGPLHFDLEAALLLTAAGGIAGRATLDMDMDDSLAELFAIDAGFQLEVNTTGRTIASIGAADLVPPIPASTALVRVTGQGDVRLFGGDLFQASGSFAFEFNAGLLSIHANGTITTPPVFEAEVFNPLDWEHPLVVEIPFIHGSMRGDLVIDTRGGFRIHEAEFSGNGTIFGQPDDPRTARVEGATFGGSVDRFGCLRAAIDGVVNGEFVVNPLDDRACEPHLYLDDRSIYEGDAENGDQGHDQWVYLTEPVGHDLVLFWQVRGADADATNAPTNQAKYFRDFYAGQPNNGIYDNPFSNDLGQTGVFPAGTTEFRIPFTIRGGDGIEENERFEIALNTTNSDLQGVIVADALSRITILNDDYPEPPPPPPPVYVYVEYLPLEVGEVTAVQRGPQFLGTTQTAAVSEGQLAPRIWATGLVPGDQVTVVVHVVHDGVTSDRKVQLTAESPARVLTFDDCHYEIHHESLVLSAELIQTAAHAPSTTFLPSVTTADIQLLNDDEELPVCSGTVLAGYTFNRLQRVEAGQGIYEFTAGPHVVAAPLLASDFSHSNTNLALSFDGGDVVRVESPPALPSAALTVDFWFRPPARPSPTTQVLLRLGGNRPLLVALSTTGQLYYTAYGIGGLAGITATIGAVDPGQWNHVAITFDGAYLRSYLNGVLRNTRVAVGSMDFAGSGLSLGARGDQGTGGFQGQLDEFHLWNRALSVSEVRQVRTTPPQEPRRGLLVAWSMNHGVQPLVNLAGSAWSGTFPAAAANRPLFVTHGAPVSATALPIGAGIPKLAPNEPAAPRTPAPAAAHWIREPGQPQASVLRNGGAEESPQGTTIPFWRASKGLWTTQPALDVDPVGGNGYFHASSTSNSDGRYEATLSQTVSVAHLANTIDAGQQEFVFGGLVRSLAADVPDAARIVLRFRNASGAQLATSDSGEVVSVGDWRKIDLRRLAPVSTRLIDVSIVAIQARGSKGAIGALFDELSLRPVQPPVPEWYEFSIQFPPLFSASSDDNDIKLVVDYLRESLDGANSNPDADSASNDIQVLTVTGIDFWNQATTGGPTAWSLRASRDEFASVLASGSTTVGQFGRSGSPVTGLQCVVPWETPLEFHLEALGTTNLPWHVDNLALLGRLHSIRECALPPLAADIDWIAVPGERLVIPVREYAIDPDGDTLIVTTPGADPNLVTATNGELAVQIRGDAAGTMVTFPYAVSDGEGGTAVGTVRIKVLAPPSATDDPYEMCEDETLIVNILDNDVLHGADVLSIALLSPALPPLGLTMGIDGSFSYTPFPDTFGAATFVYEIETIAGKSQATVSITIQPVNDPPVPQSNSFTVPEDTPRTFTAGSFIGDDLHGGVGESNQTLTLVSKSAPAGFPGTLSVGTSSFVFTPTPNYSGPATFTYVVCDNGQTKGIADPLCATGTVSLTVTAVNDPPILVENRVTTTIGTAVTIPVADLLSNDQAGPSNEGAQTLTVTQVSAAVNGTVATPQAGAVRFTPAPGFVGEASFRYTACDDGTTNGVAAPQCGTALVRVDVQPIVMAFDDSYVVHEDQLLSAGAFTGVLSNDRRTGAVVSVTLESGPLHAAFFQWQADGSFDYRPTLNFAGGDRFVYSIGPNADERATAVINVVAVNDPPVFNPISSVTICEDVADFKITLQGVAPSAAPVIGGEQNQSVTMSARSSNTSLIPDAALLVEGGPQDSIRTLRMTSSPNRNGVATITVTADDLQATSHKSSRSLSLNVLAKNDAPYFTLSGTPSSILYKRTADQPLYVTLSTPLPATSPVPPDEMSQLVQFLVPTTSNPNLIAFGAPAIVASGAGYRLNYTIRAGQFGAATITVVARDNGIADACGGQDTFERSFLISVLEAVDPNPDGSTGFTVPAIPTKGYLEGSTAFFDANRNGTRDGVDHDGDGLVSEHEFTEPAALFSPYRAIELALPASTDVNGSGRIETHEGVLVVRDGLDLSTMLPLELDLLAPTDWTVISPLSTLITSVLDRGQLGDDAAIARTLDKLGMPPVDVRHLDSILGTVLGNADAPDLFATQIQVYDTWLGLSHLLAARTEVDLRTASQSVLAALADVVLDDQASLSLTSSAALAALVDRVGATQNMTWELPVRDAAVAVLLASNSTISQLARSPDESFLESVVRVERIARTTLAADLGQLGGGQLSPDGILARHTGEALAEAVRNSQIGDVLPRRVFIDDVTFHENLDGVEAVVAVRLSQSSAWPIRVEYATRDGLSATAGQAYLPQAGLVEFVPGATAQFIRVPILDNRLDEANREFFVDLLGATHAMIADELGTISIIDDDPTVALTFVVGEAWQLLADLRDDVPFATQLAIDWGDGSMDTMTADLQDGAVPFTAEYAYGQPGHFTAIITTLDADGVPDRALRSYQVTVLSDRDGDGVSDSTEDRGPNDGDANHDGVLDRDQSHVATLPGALAGQFMTIVAPPQTSLRQVQRVDGPEPLDRPLHVDFPAGAVAFAVANVGDEEPVVVTLLLDGAIANSFYRRGVAPFPGASPWHNTLFDTPTSAVFTDNQVTVTVRGASVEVDALPSERLISIVGAWGLDRAQAWNRHDPLDVNADGFVSPIDALLVINDLNIAGSRVLAVPPLTAPGQVQFLDVNGDQFLSPVDALEVINYLNVSLPGSDEGEGEQAGEFVLDGSRLAQPEPSTSQAWHVSQGVALDWDRVISALGTRHAAVDEAFAKGFSVREAIDAPAKLARKTRFTSERHASFGVGRRTASTTEDVSRHAMKTTQEMRDQAFDEFYSSLDQ